MNNNIPKLQGYVIFSGSDGKWWSVLGHLICEKHFRHLWHARSEQDSTMYSIEVLPLEIKIVQLQIGTKQVSVL